MNNDGLEKLKEIGAQKIYEDTHIPVIHIQALLHESFDGLTKIHFIGFISILQREYNIDLSALKSTGTAYYDENGPVETTTEDGIFIAPKKRKNFTLFYILLVMIIFLIALYYSVEYANSSTHNNLRVDNTTINNAKKNINTIMLDVNTTQKENNQTVMDKNITKQKIESTPVIQKKKAVQKSLKVIARSKVWMGYIDVKTNKKYQKTFQGEFDLDSSKEWLLVFGHGYVTIIIDAQEKKFNSKKTLRLLYKDGKVTQLSFDEFKKLNRGSAW
ncbi:hypothetical protein [Sulfurimonas sp.]